MLDLTLESPASTVSVEPETYLQLKNKTAIFQQQIIILQGQFSILSAFSIEDRKFYGVYIAIRYRAPGESSHVTAELISSTVPARNPLRNVPEIKSCAINAHLQRLSAPALPKFIILNTKSIILNTKFMTLNANSNTEPSHGGVRHPRVALAIVRGRSDDDNRPTFVPHPHVERQLRHQPRAREIRLNHSSPSLCPQRTSTVSAVSAPERAQTA